MAYWTSERNRYYDPLQAVIECGENPTREKAVAALVAASKMLGVGIGAVIIALIFSGLFAWVGIFIFIGWMQAEVPPGFKIIPLIFVIFGIGVGALIIKTLLNRREASRILQELARMVQTGIVAPEDVCGLTVAAAIELYKMKSSSSLPPEPQL